VNIIKHFFIKILLLLFLTSSTLTASHIHHDDLDHEEGCEVCVLVHNFHGVDLPHSTIEISSVEYSDDETAFHEYYFLKYTFKGYYSTAPPRY